MPSVTLRTGNIFDCFPCIKNWELGNDELLHGLDLSLKLWSKSASTPAIVGNHSQNDAAEKALKRGAPGRFVTVFLGAEPSANEVYEAVDAALVELGTNKLEQLTLSYHRDCPKELTVAPWRAAEDLYSQGIVKQLAVRDFSVEFLVHLRDVAQTEPSATYVTLAYARAHPELMSYCSQTGMPLMVHGDSDHSLVFSADAFEPLAKRHTVNSSGLAWAARFAVFVDERQVVSSQGYLFGLL